MASKPLIISASRSTDIPAFYSDKLISDFEKGYTQRTNPFNRKKYTIDLQNVRFIVFWSKNPLPIIDKLKYFDKRNIKYYFQFTLNDYPEYEFYLPSLNRRIEIFKKLSDKIGKEKVIWRFDPLIISETINEKELLERLYNVGKHIFQYTEKLVISFVDLHYRKVQNRLKRNNLIFKEFTYKQKLKIAEEIKKLADEWNIEVKSCAEKEDITQSGILPNKCIDDKLIARISNDDEILLEHLQKVKKDKSQRPKCLCIESRDIGEYNTCRHNCVYCYAIR